MRTGEVWLRSISLTGCALYKEKRSPLFVQARQITSSFLCALSRTSGSSHAARFRFASSRSRAAPYTKKKRSPLFVQARQITSSFLCALSRTSGSSHAARFRFASSRSRAAPYTKKKRSPLFVQARQMTSSFLCAWLEPSLQTSTSILGRRGTG